MVIRVVIVGVIARPATFIVVCDVAWLTVMFEAILAIGAEVLIQVFVLFCLFFFFEKKLGTVDFLMGRVGTGAGTGTATRGEVNTCGGVVVVVVDVVVVVVVVVVFLVVVVGVVAFVGGTNSRGWSKNSSIATRLWQLSLLEKNFF